MPADPNWSRWIFASMANYLKATGTSHGLSLFVEGLDDRSDSFMSMPERIEARINGPFSQEVSLDCFRIWVDVNVLFVSQMGDSLKNAYDSEVSLGLFQNALDSPILLYKYGTGSGDDQSQFGCLTPRVGHGDSVRVLRFGAMNQPDRIKQTMVDARFHTYLTP